MYFTKEDYNKIAAWLKENAVKDTDFDSKDSVSASDTLVIVSDGVNYKIEVFKFINSGLSTGIIDAITANAVKINNSLTVTASNVILNNESGETLQDIIDTLEDVGDAAKGWTIKSIDPETTEPTVRAKYALYDYKNNIVGSPIRIYKDSAITNVYLGTTKDTCDPDTGEVTKYPIEDNNEALSIVYRLDTGKYSLVNVPLASFVREAEFDKYKGLGVTSNGVVYVKLSDDVETTRYLHFDSDGNISTSGIEERILEDLGTKDTSTAGDGTMWGEYKANEGTSSSTSDNSRWAEFNAAEAERESVSDSAHTVFADNWDESEDDPDAWEDPVAVESTYAYNWKSESGTASDGSTEGNLKDLYNKALDNADNIADLASEVGNIDKLVEGKAIASGNEMVTSIINKSYWTYPDANNNPTHTDGENLSAYIRTDYIDVQGGKSYHFKGNTLASGSLRTYWLDSNKKVIDVVIQPSVATTETDITAPDNAYYVILSSVNISTISFMPNENIIIGEKDSHEYRITENKTAITDETERAKAAEDALNDYIVPLNQLNASIMKEGYYPITTGSSINILTDEDNAYLTSSMIVSTKPIEVTGGSTIYFTLIYSSLCSIVEYNSGGLIVTHKNASVTKTIDGYDMFDGSLVLNAVTKYIVLSSRIANEAYKDYFTLQNSAISIRGFKTNGYIEIKDNYNTKRIETLESSVKISPLYGKSIAYFGDSLMAGLEQNYIYDTSKNVQRGFWARLNEEFSLNMIANLSEGGTAIMQPWNATSDNSISKKMYAFDNSSVDIILFTGGFNDAQAEAKEAEAGTEESSRLYKTGTVDSDFGEKTAVNNVAYAIDTAIYHLKKTNPYTKIVWIKAWYGGPVSRIDFVKKYYAVVEEACKKWSVPIIDLADDGNTNLFNDYDMNAFGRKNYTSESAYAVDTIHLNSDGYDRLYPIVAHKLESLFK